MGDPSALEVVDVAVHYGKFTAVESASLAIVPGEMVALVGPNGHGKSSLVGAVAGLVGRSGTVRAFGKAVPPASPQRAVRAGIALVPERRHLYPGLSVRDNILLGAYSGARSVWATKVWRDVGDVMDLFPEMSSRLSQLAGTLSGGQQQMVALARALAGRPRVLVLDEPCLGLAESVSRRVYDALVELNGQGVTILVVEENPIRALAVCKRVLRMYRGMVGAAEPSRAGAER